VVVKVVDWLVVLEVVVLALVVDDVVDDPPFNEVVVVVVAVVPALVVVAPPDPDPVTGVPVAVIAEEAWLMETAPLYKVGPGTT
jgi:hypothetical protein